MEGKKVYAAKRTMAKKLLVIHFPFLFLCNNSFYVNILDLVRKGQTFGAKGVNRRDIPLE